MKKWQAGCLGAFLAIVLLAGACFATLLAVGIFAPEETPTAVYRMPGEIVTPTFPPPTRRVVTATPEPVSASLDGYRALTWKELVSFITADHTNWHDYIPDDYVCLNFAVDLVHNARDEKIKAWVVGVFFENEEVGHAFSAFETSDRGMVYIEPQTDIPYIEPQVGRPLCDAWTGQNCFGVIEEIIFMECPTASTCYKISAPDGAGGE